jgi:hypothetical protein
MKLRVFTNSNNSLSVSRAKHYGDLGVEEIIVDENITRDCDTRGFCPCTFEKMDSSNKQEAERRRKGFEAFIEAMLNGKAFAENWGHLCVI